jgi:hypothetical protein
MNELGVMQWPKSSVQITSNDKQFQPVLVGQDGFQIDSKNTMNGNYQ